jgi:hypothetical protein
MVLVCCNACHNESEMELSNLDQIGHTLAFSHKIGGFFNAGVFGYAGVYSVHMLPFSNLSSTICIQNKSNRTKLNLKFSIWNDNKF